MDTLNRLRQSKPKEHLEIAKCLYHMAEGDLRHFKAESR